MIEFVTITMDEAKKIFAKAGNYIILDVRTPEEYAEGHIPGAINIANETIGGCAPAGLPDKDQEIYVYCRSGGRSADASSKLFNMGYDHITNCGGILDWTGDIER